MLPKTNNMDPKIKITIAQNRSALESGSGIPFDAMNEAVPEKLLILPGNALTNNAAMRIRPRTSRALETLMERFKRIGGVTNALVADLNPTCHQQATA